MTNRVIWTERLRTRLAALKKAGTPPPPDRQEDEAWQEEALRRAFGGDVG